MGQQAYLGICAKCDWTCEGIAPSFLKMALFSHCMGSRRCMPNSPTEIDSMIYEVIE